MAMIELIPENKLGFIYDTESFELLKYLGDFNYSIIGQNDFNGKPIFTIQIARNISLNKQSINILEIGQIKCQHGNNVDYESINLLPNEGWEELVDCWSCHNDEFKGMIDLKIKPRNNGILASHLYLVSHPSVLPECCNYKSKFFFNELKIKFSDANLIYRFFDDYFNIKNTFVFSQGEEVYEIKYFYKCWVIESKCIESMKIGFKKLNVFPIESHCLNNYYIDYLIKHLHDNSIHITVIDYELNFIKSC